MSSAFSGDRDEHAKLTPTSKIAGDLAKPARKSAGIRKGRPQIVDPSRESIFRAHDSGAID
jgi:hypothetical protein